MEVLEAGPGGRPSRHRALLVILLAVVLAVVATVVVAVPAPSAQPPPAPAPTPTPTPTPDATPDSTPDLTPSTAEIPVTWSIDPFPAGVDEVIYARSADSVFRIETRAGRVTATRTAAVAGWVSFVAGQDAVLGQQWFGAAGDAGFLVRVGRRAESLPAALQAASQVLPAADGRLWVATTHAGRTVVRLTDFAGRPIAGSKPVKLRDWPMVLPDGRGGIWRPAGTVLGGQVVAVGTNHLLTQTCGPALWCRHRLVDRATGRARLLPHSYDLPATGYLAGRISPDGRYAAAYTGAESPQLSVVDLRRGTTVLRYDGGRDLGDPASLHWLADGRLLLLRDGRLTVFDPATRRSVAPELKLPRLLQLTR